MPFVYVLTNPSMPNLFKVGHTTRSVHARVAELNTTGVPTPFELAAQYQVYDSERVESKTHFLLRKHRINDNREFFKTDRDTIGRAIMAAIAVTGDQAGPQTKQLLSQQQLDAMAAEKERQQAERERAEREQRQREQAEQAEREERERARREEHREDQRKRAQHLVEEYGKAATRIKIQAVLAVLLILIGGVFLLLQFDQVAALTMMPAVVWLVLLHEKWNGLLRSVKPLIETARSYL